MWVLKIWKKLTLCLSQRFLAWLYFLAWYSIYATIAEKNSLFTTPNNEWWHFIVWQCKITLNNALCKWPVKRFCTLKGNVVSNILTVKKSGQVFAQHRYPIILRKKYAFCGPLHSHENHFKKEDGGTYLRTRLKEL